MMRRIAWGAAFAALLGGASAHAETSPKIAPELVSAFAKSQTGRFDVLVYLKDQADLSAAKAQSSKAAKGKLVASKLRLAAKAQAKLLASIGDAKLAHRSYYIVNAVLVRGVDQAQIEAFAARQDVAQIFADNAVQVIPPQDAARFKDEKATKAVGDNITSTGAERVWALGKKGEGITVAGNDTGIEMTHVGLKSHYRGLQPNGTVSHDYNWHDAIHESLNPGRAAANPCGYDTAAPCDDNGHGTHTAGTMVGDDGAGNQVGMAPGAKLIGCRNMDEGVGKPSTYLECFEYFLAPWAYGASPTSGDPEKAPDVINNSWGCPSDEGCNGSEFLPALRSLAAAGVMVVAAAGNEGSGCGTIGDGPAHHSDEVFVVGALDHRSGTIASFSSRGPSGFDAKVGPDLSAPGVSIRSSILGGGYSGSFWSGTSMAAPHVAGAVALLWSAKPELVGRIPETIAKFTGTAVAKTSSQTCGGVSGATIPNNTFGFGQLDVHSAVTR